MRVAIWSDVVCPWCYIGKRRLEKALGAFAHAGDVEIEWHSFELDPRAPRVVEGDPATRLAAKYGMTRDEAVANQARLTALAADEGLAFRLAESRSGNTFDAHRLLHLAADRGVQGAAKERLLAAYLTEGEAIGDPDTLVRLVSEAGVDAEEARLVLASDKYADAVRADERRAQELGITGVPFFVMGGRYAVPGAQPVELLLEALNRAWEESQPVVLAADGPVCDGDSCTI